MEPSISTDHQSKCRKNNSAVSAKQVEGKAYFIAKIPESKLMAVKTHLQARTTGNDETRLLPSLQPGIVTKF